MKRYRVKLNYRVQYYKDVFVTVDTKTANEHEVILEAMTKYKQGRHDHDSYCLANQEEVYMEAELEQLP